MCSEPILYKCIHILSMACPHEAQQHSCFEIFIAMSHSNYPKHLSSRLKSTPSYINRKLKWTQTSASGGLLYSSHTNIGYLPTQRTQVGYKTEILSAAARSQCTWPLQSSHTGVSSASASLSTVIILENSSVHSPFQVHSCSDIQRWSLGAQSK